jgi:hypothetical protein
VNSRVETPFPGKKENLSLNGEKSRPIPSSIALAIAGPATSHGLVLQVERGPRERFGFAALSGNTHS